MGLASRCVDWARNLSLRTSFPSYTRVQGTPPHPSFLKGQKEKVHVLYLLSPLPSYLFLLQPVRHMWTGPCALCSGTAIGDLLVATCLHLTS